MGFTVWGVRGLGVLGFGDHVSANDRNNAYCPGDGDGGDDNDFRKIAPSHVLPNPKLNPKP